MFVNATGKYPMHMNDATESRQAASVHSHLLDDILGGFASMLVALPSSIAFGMSVYAVLGKDYAAYGAMSGILGAIVLGILAPLLGGGQRMVSAPCAPAAAVMGALAAELVRETNLQPQQTIALMTLAHILSGSLQLLYGVLGGGRLIKYIPFPVVSGYLAGVGAIIFIGQLPILLGSPNSSGFWDAFLNPDSWKWESMTVGAATILGIVAAPKIIRTIPATIIGLIAGFVCYAVLVCILPELRHLAGNELVIGPLFAKGVSVFDIAVERLHGLQQMRLADFEQIFTAAITLSVLLSIDTLKTSVVMDALTRSRFNTDKELRGQGLSNLMSAIAGGMPGAATMGPTLVNHTSGGKTRRAAVLEGVFVLLAALALGWLICWIPKAALAGLLIVIALRMFDRHSFLLLKQKSTILDFVVIAAVVVVAVTVNLIAATGAGIALAILLFIREQIRGSVIRRKIYGNSISSKRVRLPEEQAVLEQYGHRTVVCELQGSLFFGTTDQLMSLLEADLKLCRFVILDMRRVLSVDFTAVHLLDQISATLAERDGCLLFSDLPASLPSGQKLEDYFEQAGLLKQGSPIKIFDNLDEALEWAEDAILEEHRLLVRGEEKPMELPELELLREFESDGTLPAIKGCISIRSCKQGEYVFKAGDAGDELFLIRRGIIRISIPLNRDKHILIATFGRGNFFGEVAFLDKGRRSADAIAQTDAELFVISRTKFDELSKAHPILGVKLFARLARGLAIRLRHTDRELQALKEA